MVRRWKRETSPPVTKLVAPSIGLFIAWLSRRSSSILLAPVGTLTEPLAMARSSSDWLSAIERSDRLSEPIVSATWIFSAMRGVTSSVTVLDCLTTLLPSMISDSVD